MRRTPRRLARRQVLRGLAATLPLPFLESVAPARATPPVRAAWLYFPNGASAGSFAPGRTDAAGRLLSLTPQMAPLERHRAQLTLVRRLHTPRGNGHGAGTATWLTGGGWDARALDPGGPSVDQIAAQRVGAGCVAPALSLRARGEGFFSADVPRNTLSWSGPGRPVFRETDPRAVFQLLFGTGVSTEQSLLDDLRSQAADARRVVSRADQERLDAYLEAVRGLERRVAFVQDEATRARLDQARAFGLGFDASQPLTAVPEDHGAYLDLLLDLAALALFSGASRVASVLLDHGQSNRYCTFLPGVKGTWHALSHWKDASGRTDDDDGVTAWDSVATKRQMYDAVVTWHHERVARFLDRLAAFPEAGGTLLDHTLVVYGSSLADGYDHGERDLPTLLAGAAGGAVRTGRVLDPGGPTDLAALHLSTLHALGAEVVSFGAADQPLALT